MQKDSTHVRREHGEEVRLGRPKPSDAAPFYFTYIDQVQSDRILDVLNSQLAVTLDAVSQISDRDSLYRYAPDKWSIRQMFNHITDAERIFTFRALWFARGLPGALPSFDQDLTVAAAQADAVSWSSQVDDFRHVRLATISLFDNLPADAWTRSGVASGSSLTVHALAFITAGHVAHHLHILHERYLPAMRART